MEGISLRTPPPPQIFHFFEVSYNPPPIPLDFPQYDEHPPNPSRKFRSRTESVKNEATDPNLIEAKPFRLRRTCLYCLFKRLIEEFPSKSHSVAD